MRLYFVALCLGISYSLTSLWRGRAQLDFALYVPRISDLPILLGLALGVGLILFALAKLIGRPSP